MCVLVWLTVVGVLLFFFQFFNFINELSFIARILFIYVDALENFEKHDWSVAIYKKKKREKKAVEGQNKLKYKYAQFNSHHTIHLIIGQHRETAHAIALVYTCSYINTYKPGIFYIILKTIALQTIIIIVNKLRKKKGE